MTKLTPKQSQAIDEIIDGANPLLFVHLSKLLGVSTAMTREEKKTFLRKVLNHWEQREWFINGTIPKKEV